MRGELERLRSEGYEVDFETVVVGHQRNDGVGRLVSAAEARAFFAVQPDSESSDLAALDDHSLTETLAIVALDEAREALADRKWCCRMWRARLEELAPDPVDALMQIEEFWVRWRYPGPYGALGATEWVAAEKTLEVVLARLRRWLHDEHEAIEAAENPGLHRRTIDPG